MASGGRRRGLIFIVIALVFSQYSAVVYFLISQRWIIISPSAPTGSRGSSAIQNKDDNHCDHHPESSPRICNY